jgi:hypothetical protein
MRIGNVSDGVQVKIASNKGNGHWFHQIKGNAYIAHEYNHLRHHPTMVLSAYCDKLTQEPLSNNISSNLSHGHYVVCY